MLLLVDHITGSIDQYVVLDDKYHFTQLLAHLFRLFHCIYHQSHFVSVKSSLYRHSESGILNQRWVFIVILVVLYSLLMFDTIP